MAVYVHVSCHKFEKLSPHGKKCIFIWYLKHSIGYVFIGENKNGNIYEIESRDVTFLEHDFPTKRELQKDFQLMEMVDPNSGSHQDKLQ